LATVAEDRGNAFSSIAKLTQGKYPSRESGNMLFMVALGRVIPRDRELQFKLLFPFAPFVGAAR
jgi:hypothetical protein